MWIFKEDLWFFLGHVLFMERSALFPLVLLKYLKMEQWYDEIFGFSSVMFFSWEIVHCSHW